MRNRMKTLRAFVSATVVSGVALTGMSVTPAAANGGDASDDGLNPTPVLVGSVTAEDMGSGDVDWFSFTAESEETWVGLSEHRNDVDVLVFDSNADFLVSSSWGTSHPDAVVVSTTVGATYKVQVRGWSATPYNLTVDNYVAAPDTVGDTADGATELPRDTFYSDFFGIRDVDYFTIAVTPEMIAGERALDIWVDTDEWSSLPVKLTSPSGFTTWQADPYRTYGKLGQKLSVNFADGNFGSPLQPGEYILQVGEPWREYQGNFTKSYGGTSRYPDGDYSVLVTTKTGGLVPSLGDVVRTADGFTAEINNWHPYWDWNPIAVPGNATVNFGQLIVTGLNPGELSVVSLSSSRNVPNQETDWWTGSTMITGSALQESLAPQVSAATPTADGFTAEITNYDPDWSWEAEVEPGQATVNGDLVTVTGIGLGETREVFVTASKDGHASGVTSFSGTSLNAALSPTLSAATSTNDGFTAEITNYNPDWSWTATTDAGSVDRVNGTVVVSGLEPGQEATVVVTASRDGHVDGSAAVSGAARTVTPPVPPVPPVVPPVAPPTVEEKPGKVRKLKAKVKKAVTRISWKAPRAGGPVDEYRYVIKKKSGKKGKKWRAAVKKTVTKTVGKHKLKPGKYKVHVTAINASGAGPAKKRGFAVRSR